MSTTSNANVLFVSDSPEDKYSVKQLLEGITSEIYIAEARIRAFQLLAATHIDLAVCDIKIPQSTGIEFCRALRTETKYSHIPIVIIGVATDDECVAALEAGADDFIRCPFNDKEFCLRIQRLLRKNNRVPQSKLPPLYLSSSDLPGLLQYLAASRKTGKLMITRIDQEIATILIRVGRIANAIAPYCKGIDAVTEILSWDSIQLRFHEEPLEADDIEFDYEIAGTIMNCMIAVEAYLDVRKSLPPNEMIYVAGGKNRDELESEDQAALYDLALDGHTTRSLIESPECDERTATLALHKLIEENYLLAVRTPFHNYQEELSIAYPDASLFEGRAAAIGQSLASIDWPLPETRTVNAYRGSQNLRSVPKIAIACSDFKRGDPLVKAMSTIASSVSGLAPDRRKTGEGSLVTRVYLQREAIFDIQQLPPNLQQFSAGAVDELVRDSQAILFLTIDQDKKSTQANLRQLRQLRDRFRGVYFFAIPTTGNPTDGWTYAIDCPECANSLSISSELPGYEAKCPRCREKITIPHYLDHLARTLKLPENIPIARLAVADLSACCALFKSMFDAVREAYKMQKG